MEYREALQTGTGYAARLATTGAGSVPVLTVLAAHLGAGADIQVSGPTNPNAGLNVGHAGDGPALAAACTSTTSG